MTAHRRMRAFAGLLALVLLFAVVPASAGSGQGDDGAAELYLPQIKTDNEESEQRVTVGVDDVPEDVDRSGIGDRDSVRVLPAPEPPAEHGIGHVEEPVPEAPAEADDIAITDLESIDLYEPEAYDRATWYVQNRLGVGTDTPAHKMEVRAGINAVSGIAVSNRSTGNSTSVRILLGTSGSSQQLELRKYGANHTGTWDSINLSNWARIRTLPNANGLIVTTGGSDSLVLGTNNKEQLRLTPGGRLGIGTRNPGFKIDVRAKWLSGVSVSSSGVYAMRAYNESTSGDKYGLFTRTDSTDGYAVYAHASADLGETYGLYAKSESTSGHAVYAWTSATSGQTTTIYARNSSSTGIALSVHSQANSGYSVGINASNASTDGVTIYAQADATSGTTYGVWAKNYSSGGKAGNFHAESNTGTTYGVIGRSDSRQGRGVYGYAAAGTGDTEGVIAYARSNDGEAFEAWHAGDSSTANIIVACSKVNCGSDSTKMKVLRNGHVYADGSFHGGGADYADMLAVADDVSKYEPGDVLVIEENAQLVLSDAANSTAVVGVHSTDPAMIGDPLGIWDGESVLRSEREILELLAKDRVPVAMAGMVPVKVTAENGTIMPGDLLTTSSTPGHAMKATVFRRGSIIGKAMTSLDGDEGVIQMLVMMQ